MFRIECFCEDRKLVEVLHALNGLVTMHTPPQPVVNAALVNGKLSAKTDGSAMQLLAAWIKKNKLKQLRMSDMRNFAKENGKSPGSAGYFTNQAIKAGILKKHGRNGNAYFEVL